jgi:hypothetical protein
VRTEARASSHLNHLCVRVGPKGTGRCPGRPS